MILSKVFDGIIFYRRAKFLQLKQWKDGRKIKCTSSYQTAYADTGRKMEEGIGMWVKLLLSAAIIALGVYTAYQMIKYT